MGLDTIGLIGVLWHAHTHTNTPPPHITEYKYERTSRSPGSSSVPPDMKRFWLRESDSIEEERASSDVPKPADVDFNGRMRKARAKLAIYYATRTLSSVCLYVCLSVCLCLSICLSVCLSPFS